ncbi:zinc finger protein ubi-d4 isoform X3 [Centruroides vittatus]|uniref:zinc finger protein ubi-d4 isoform X3 n=1 Tax=Centruroides vittatus TaxID=120091 RepID=UPI00350FE3A8
MRRIDYVKEVSMRVDKSQIKEKEKMAASTETLKVNWESVDRLKSILSDPFYKDAIENSASYNTRLRVERKMRLPFLDAQTGVAQSDCALWMQKWQRMPGMNDGQLYTYPAKRWRKKRRQYLMNDRYLTCRTKETDTNETDMHQISVMENSAAQVEGDVESADKLTEDSKDSWYKDFDEASDPPDIGELDDGDSDYDEYEDSYLRKKKRKVRNTRSKKKTERNDYSAETEKPYSCELCGARYKTRPGLSYHYMHSHNSVSAENTEEDSSNAPSNASPSCHVTGSTPSSAGPSSDNPLAGQKSASGKSGVSASPYCDFCLGDNVENKKTRQAEELVSCADCGRSAHPTCLQFTPNMTNSVKKYRWQCIECKSCGLCGTSDNDDQLLFCDDCDRGYHMYCLNPPLSEPPEGSWSCHLCIEEYGKK